MIILFDLDGTLIDSTEAILESFSVAFETHGRTVPESELIKAQIGHPLDVMFASLGVEEAKVWDYVHAYKMHYRQISCQKTVLLPDAKAAVELASKHARLGVVTTKTAQYSIELLEHLDLMHHFEVLIGRENVENPKPHPEPIFKALEVFPDFDGEVWMIGDTCMDMHAAKAANIEGIGLTCGYADKSALKACTEYIHSSALEAVTFLANR